MLRAQAAVWVRKHQKVSLEVVNWHLPLARIGPDYKIARYSVGIEESSPVVGCKKESEVGIQTGPNIKHTWGKRRATSIQLLWTRQAFMEEMEFTESLNNDQENRISKYMQPGIVTALGV
jgi:hypothetical protein